MMSQRALTGRDVSGELLVAPVYAQCASSAILLSLGVFTVSMIDPMPQISCYLSCEFKPH